MAKNTGGRAQRAALPLGRDRGSVSPLVIGMTLCLLILAAGVVAAGSAFLGGQKLQRQCDGAAQAAADAAPSAIAASSQASITSVYDAASEYLSIRGSGVLFTITIDQGIVLARCRADVPITFGGIFGTPTLERNVDAVGQPRFN
ncbi:hypothetical protein EH165_13315 [Nakamurella antarctica]|uniref:Putative Flp pilus-assembly TadG-like N-terminal domain-containing protein n=1 Tax=Nakamurella antarctica TaxID=1902245 RepID=A0A3G8ZNV9_9ACTN|nr:pilus assembly protein TadG-related protein [Nakamurella antarctica]AZI58979.1 hypothetical protein EH165_13315 [Nakamurella antarctica]